MDFQLNGVVRRLGHVCLALVITVVLASCTQEPQGQTRDFSLLANRQNPNGGAVESKPRGLFSFFGQRTGATRQTGTDEFANLPRPTLPLASQDRNGEYTLNLVDVPVTEAARAVFGTVLERPFFVSPEVTGTVTLQTSMPLNEQQLLEALEAALALAGATLEFRDGTARILQSGAATPQVVAAGDRSIGARVVAVPLQHVNTAQMAEILTPIAGQTVTIQELPTRNLLLIRGNRAELNSLLEAVNIFDVDTLSGKSIALVPLKSAQPNSVVSELDVIFESGQGGPLEGVVTFVPSNRLGAVLVISKSSSYLPRAEKWIRELDRTAGTRQRRPVIYALQNRRAQDVAPILEQMLDDVVQAEGEDVEGTPKVVADEGQNAVIVWGNSTEQEVFARLVPALDTTPVQVLLEATIAEVNLTDDLQFGLRWFFENGDFSGNFTDNIAGTTGPVFPGLNFLFQGTDSAVTLSALNSVTELNIISSPSLMVLDNQEALLQIGDEVPIATQSVVDTSDPTAPIVNSITYNQTGVILSVRPRVSSSGHLTLEIDQQVSSADSTSTSGIDSPTISQRSISTTVSVRDGETIALGGLISETQDRVNDKVPGLGDVPLVGGLFRSRQDNVDKTELLILITPRVIRNGNETRAITAELRERLGNANRLITTDPGTPSIGHRILN